MRERERGGERERERKREGRERERERERGERERQREGGRRGYVVIINLRAQLLPHRSGEDWVANFCHTSYVAIVRAEMFSHAPGSTKGVRSKVAMGYRCPFSFTK